MAGFLQIMRPQTSGVSWMGLLLSRSERAAVYSGKGLGGALRQGYWAGALAQLRRRPGKGARIHDLDEDRQPFEIRRSAPELKIRNEEFL
jgi:hypothetical protein